MLTDSADPVGPPVGAEGEVKADGEAPRTQPLERASIQATSECSVPRRGGQLDQTAGSAGGRAVSASGDGLAPSAAAKGLATALSSCTV
jgi:hypothetical protein